MSFGNSSEVPRHSMGLFEELHRADSGSVERCRAVVESFMDDIDFGQSRYPAYFYSVLFSIFTGHSLCKCLDDSFGIILDCEDIDSVFNTAKESF